MATITLSEFAPTQTDAPNDFRAPNGEEGGVVFSIEFGGSLETSDQAIIDYASESCLLEVDGAPAPYGAAAPVEVDEPVRFTFDNDEDN